jgi:hypothetical protein
MPEPVTLRPRGGMIIAAIALVITAAALVFIAIDGGLLDLARWAWPVVLLGWGAWLLYLRPYVRVSEGFVEISNLVRTYRVPWGDIDSVDSRFALTIRTRGGRVIRAWAAPAPGARQALSTQRADVTHTPGDDDTRRPSDAEGTASGDAAGLVRRELERHRREGTAAVGQTALTWHPLLIAGTAALAAAAVVSLVLPHG